MNRYDPIKNKKTAGISVLVAIAFLALAAAGAWFYFNYQRSEVFAEPETQVLALPSDRRDAGAVDSLSLNESGDRVASADNIVELQQDSAFILPDLDHSDALLREEIVGISPDFAGLLDTDQLIRKYVVIANDVSQGLRLEKHLRFVVLEPPFAVDQDKDSLFIAAGSYRRYDRLAAALNGLDVSATLAVYKKFRPLLLQVFREFSYADEYSLEDIFTQAAAVILAAPVVDGQIALVKHSIYYKFADQQLEALSPIQKQMLRMGPENTRIIQNKLRLLIEALANLKEE